MTRWRTRETTRSFTHDALIIVMFCLLVTSCEQSKPPKGGGDGSATQATEQSKGGGDVTGLTWQWRYDRNGRVSEIEAPGHVTTRVTYTDPEGKASSGQTSTVEVGGEKRSFTWDHQGRLVNAQGSGGTVAINHNTAGLPAEVRSGGAPTIRYAYDVQDRLTETRIGDGLAIRYRYDYLGRLAAIVTPAGDITYSYHRASSTVNRHLPNGVQTIWEYDDEGKLLRLTHVDVKSAVVIAKYAYAYRPDGLLEEIATYNQRNGLLTCRYQYDLMQRLTDVACKGVEGSHRFGYDSLGNLAESQTAGGQTLRFTSTPAGALATDSRGATQTDERGHVRRLPALPSSIDYTFNGAGELSAAVANGRKIEYVYNSLGLLTAHKVDGRETRYLPDPFADAWHPLWQRDANGTETVTVWDGAGPVLAVQGKEARFRLEDHLGSVRAEVDSRGSVVAWHDYSPYGVPEGAESDEVRPGFAGLFWDPNARVYHAMARAYDPVTARFLQPDPQLRVPGASKHSHSLYAYTGGDPVNFVDRNGAEAVPYETIGFNSGRRWWDNYFRALDYHALGWFRKAIKSDAPLVVNTAPDIRNSVVKHIVDTARKSSEDIDALDQTVKDWRFGKAPIPEELKKLFVSEQEWQAAENYTTALHEVNKFDQALGSVGRGIGSVWTVGLSGGWLAIKNVSSAAGLPPFFDKNESWIPTTIGTLRWQARGIRDAWDSRYSAPPKSFLQQLDDFLSQPVYGDEIFEDSNSMVPLPAGGTGPDATRLGKRGGRGGGMEASPVGGVRLGGAGKALEGLGQLKGIAVDEATGKLVLIGSNEQKIGLPPLRLDDVVTVFRAVYNHGESPSVTIDPDETNPEGPKMDVKHGPGTAGTYVGWILFECDRVMKTYQLGEDNVTHQAVESRVPGYAETLDAVFFADARQAGAEVRNWERFWIVPAAVRRFDATSTDLSLFEVPLKVNTQKMRMKVETKGGKQVHTLVDDEEGKSSAGAIAFKNWFSEQYAKIADEVRLTPPPGNGFEQQVAIFHELQRIALIAAVAERLRDLGEPMPMWMHDYPVAPFAVPPITPSLTVPRESKDGINRAIYGGVSLSPADRDVYAFSTSKTVDARSSEAAVKFVKWSSEEVRQLEPKIRELARLDEPIGTVHPVTTPQGKKFTVSAMPGGHTRALAPNRQEVADLVVSIGLGRNLSLTRYYNSFFDPAGAFGRGWTLDLPQLVDTRVPVKRDGKRSEYRVVQHLLSPLGTVNIRFDERKTVEPYGIEMPVAKDHPEIAGIAGGDSEILGFTTSKVLFRDGTAWHFDAKGRLVLVETSGTGTRYVWDSVGRVQQIVAHVGTERIGAISFGYDQQGRIIEATANQADDLRKQAPAEVSKLAFEYGDDGRLRSVLRLEPKQGKTRNVEWAYSYEGNQLAKIGGADRIETSFGYNARGELLWRKQGEEKTEYAMTATPEGTTFTTTGGDGARLEKWTYDERVRPVQADLGSGRTARWKYGKDQEVIETLSQDGKPIVTRSASPDGRTERTVLSDGRTYEVRKNQFGRPAALSIDGQEVARMSWNADGSLARLRGDETEVLSLPHESGWPSGVVISAPRVDGQTSEWLQQTWDVLGRPIKITDSSGFEYKLGYDEYGRLQKVRHTSKEGKTLGMDLDYDDSGVLIGIESSWAKEQREYSKDGALKRVEIKRQGAKSVTEYDKEGRLLGHRAFDGGTTNWRYDSHDAEALLRAVELPNGKRIDYASEDSGEVHRSQVALESTVVETVSDERGRVTKLTWGETAR